MRWRSERMDRQQMRVDSNESAICQTRGGLCSQHRTTREAVSPCGWRWHVPRSDADRCEVLALEVSARREGKARRAWRVPEISLEDARRRREGQRSLLRDGVDPMAKRRALAMLCVSPSLLDLGCWETKVQPTEHIGFDNLQGRGEATVQGMVARALSVSICSRRSLAISVS